MYLLLRGLSAHWSRFSAPRQGGEAIQPAGNRYRGLPVPPSRRARQGPSRSSGDFRPMRLCSYFNRPGGCIHGNACTFAHSGTELPRANSEPWHGAHVHRFRQWRGPAHARSHMRGRLLVYRRRVHTRELSCPRSLCSQIGVL
mmetsp:Transcript_88570/g.274271  ORF Transcript_88570/g.274271 Transcript_88570/m.274271 type:complete len:143 (-) Transcript_88570:7-435(-)